MIPAQPDAEIGRLKERLRKLAEEKAYLQLIIRLIEHLNPLSGLEDMVLGLLRTIVDTIGSTNIRLYYWVDDTLHYIDVLGERKVLAEVDDPIIAEVIAHHNFIERPVSDEDALLMGDVVPGAWTWVFPLLVGPDLVGVIKMENLHISATSLRSYLPLLFSHTALILSNETRNLSRQKAVAALAESREQYRLLLDSTGEGIFGIDLNGAITFCNTSALALLGYAGVDDLLGRNAHMVTGHAHADGSPCLSESCYVLHSVRFAETAHVEGELFHRADGKPFPVDYRSHPVVRDGVTVGAVVSFIDITRRRRDEEELRRYRDHLVDLVEERTRELARARDDAEAANRAKSIFLANMSHELRTPLNAILGFSNLLRRDAATTPDQRETIGIIERSGEHLLSLINDVLDMSKIESGHVMLDPANTDLHVLLQDVGGMMRLRAQSKGLSFVVDLADDLPRLVRLDTLKLRQVLLNLCGNAVKYTYDGGVCLRAASQPDGPGWRLRFEIEDSGRGIADADLQAIFQPFMQVDGSAASEGAGLGLAITRSFARLMGGDVTVTSRPGEGSLFCVEVRAEPANQLAAVPELRSPRVMRLAPDQPLWRVLVADDSETNRLLLSTLLTGAGFQVRQATNGREAVEVFEDWRPHFIWMDVRMPIMDGYEATRRIKASEGGAETVVVALTASAFSDERDRVTQAGCAGIIHKPFRETAIFNALECYLGARFLYEDDVIPVFGELEPIGDLTAAMAALARTSLDALRHAVIECDIAAIEGAIAGIACRDAGLAARLREYAAQFRYAELGDLVASAIAAKEDAE